MILMTLATFTKRIGLKILIVALFFSNGFASEKEASGKNCLFAGHSFFIPVARSFNGLAKAAGVEGHSQMEVFRGGKNGAPGSLWSHEPSRLKIQESLDAGKIDLFGMTLYSTNSTIQDYKRWIDYALKKNPEVEIYIGIPWGRTAEKGGVKRSLEAYKKGTIAFQKRIHKDLILKLRSMYPKNKVTCSYYGMASSELWSMHKAEKLPGISRMAKTNSVYRDAMGHAGDVLLTVSGLVWLNTIYGVDITKVKVPKVDFKFDYKAVAAKVIAVDKEHNPEKIKSEG